MLRQMENGLACKRRAAKQSVCHGCTAAQMGIKKRLRAGASNQSRGESRLAIHIIHNELHYARVAYTEKYLYMCLYMDMTDSAGVFSVNYACWSAMAST